jgi:peptidoglycan/xylan/chitin deacetylase (PgdA/CDA1 family)
MLPGFAGTLAPLLRDRAVVFMLHRFRDSARGVEGHEAEQVRELLEYLRKHRYELVSLEEVFRRLSGQGPRPAGCIAFTLDDGYLDQAEVAGPLFAEFDCPATTFVATGFLDGKLWFWWDRIDFVFSRTELREIHAELDGGVHRFAWNDVPARNRARDEFTAWCKTIPDASKHRAIEELAQAAEVELPDRPPDAFAPMSWSQLRACEGSGMSFGPHTVTHPVLSRTDDGQSKYELEEGWNRLRAEAERPVPIFCYPNGQVGDFGPREIATLRELGMAGAVVGTPGHASVDHFARDGDSPFEVRRFSLPIDLPDSYQLVSGFERLKQILRREDTT